MSEPLSLFGQDPWWISLIKAVGIFAMMMVLTILAVWFERRVVGAMQQRIGPNRVGPFGLLQALMDGVKLALKEEIIPKGVHIGVYWIAPVISATTAFLAGLRSSAQMISYEISMGLSFVAVFLYAGSMSTSQIVLAQEPVWYAVILLPSFLIYCTAMVGETNRPPFDLPEAEGELVGGFHTEYSSLKFALFFLAEYINMVTVSALATTLFLGGWRAPWPLSLWDGANQGWWPMLWWLLKVQIFILVLLAISWVWQGSADRKAATQAAAQAPVAFDAMAGGFPVPPMPGQQADLTSRRAAAGGVIVQDRPADVQIEAEEGSNG